MSPKTDLDIPAEPPGGEVVESTVHYTIVDRDGARSIRCKACGAESHNPNDVAYRYCGRCHVFYVVRR